MAFARDVANTWKGLCGRTWRSKSCCWGRCYVGSTDGVILGCRGWRGCCMLDRVAVQTNQGIVPDEAAGRLLSWVACSACIPKGALRAIHACQLSFNLPTHESTC